MTNDDAAWGLVLGGIMGAAFAAPKQQDTKELEEYRKIKQQLFIRQQGLGPLPPFEKLQAQPQIYNAFIESYNLHLLGYFRSASILCSALLESLLKEKYGEKNFVDLVNEAGQNKLLEPAEIHYLHGIRLYRNDFVHNILLEVREQDSQLILISTIKLLNKILNNQ
ncbi:MAG: hypothetical protein WCW13_03485 [archaeon]|jgi:hypothetical protein